MTGHVREDRDYRSRRSDGPHLITYALMPHWDASTAGATAFQRVAAALIGEHSDPVRAKATVKP